MVSPTLALLDGNAQEDTIPSVMKTLNELKAIAHFLNFLDCHYASSELVKEQTKTILKNTAMMLGIVFNEMRVQRDCSENTHITIDDKKKEPLENPSQITLEDYNTIIQVYHRFIETGEGQITAKAGDFVESLFSDLDNIEINSERMRHFKGKRGKFIFAR
jgi:predicted MPP superfamily phosphohydrolase